MSRYQQFTSPSIVLTILIGGIVGAAIGLALDSVMTYKPILAIVAAFLAILASTLVRHFTIFASIRGAGPGPGRSVLPGAVLVNAMIAAVCGGLAGYVISLNILSPPPSAWIGCLSGVFACVAMELLMTAYRAHTQE